MRREQVLKICLNHALKSDIIYKPKDDKTWLFAANDFSEGEFILYQFCLRFKTKEIALEFKEAIDKALEVVTDTISSNDMKSQKQDSDDVIFVSEIQATVEEKQKAKELMLPENFYTYKIKTPCEGCIGCKDDDETINSPSKSIETPSVPVYLSTPTKAEKSVFLSPSRSLYGTPGTLDKTLDTTIFRTPLGSIGSAVKSETPPSSKNNSTNNNDDKNKENTSSENPVNNLPKVFRQTTTLEKSENKNTDSQLPIGSKTFNLAQPKLNVQINISREKLNTEPKSTLALTSSKFDESKSIFESPKLETASTNSSIFGFQVDKMDNKNEVKSIFGEDHKSENMFSTSFQGSIFGPGALKSNETKTGGGLFGQQNLAFSKGKSIFDTKESQSFKLPSTVQKTFENKSPNNVDNNNKSEDLKEEKEIAENSTFPKEFVTFADLKSSGQEFTGIV